MMSIIMITVNSYHIFFMAAYQKPKQKFKQTDLLTSKTARCGYYFVILPFFNYNLSALSGKT